MNLNVSIFLDYDGDKIGIESLLSDLADVLLEYKLGNSDDPDSAVRSLIFLKAASQDTFDLDLEMTNSYSVIMPVEEEKVG